MIGRTPLPSSIRQRLNKLWMLVFICLGSTSITACDYINKKLYPDFKVDNVKSPVDKPPFARANPADAISIEKVRDVAEAQPIQNTVAQNDASFSVNPVALNNEMAAEKTLKTDQLFAQDIKTPEDRFKRLETSVQKIASTLNKMSPSITKLIGIESELDALTFQLEELINKGKYDALVKEQSMPAPMIEKKLADTKIESMPKMAQPIPETKTKAKVKSKPKPKAKSKAIPRVQAGDFIKKMRVGDDSGKTRIVFETSERLDYTVTVDNAEKIALISFPKGNVSSNPNILAQYSNLIKSMVQQKDGEGAAFIIDLSKDTEVLKKMRIGPDKHITNHRIVIDLKR